MAPTRVDVSALFSALDAARKEREQSWRQLAKDIGVSPSLLSRISNGYRPDADGFVTLVRWLGMPVEAFVLEDGVESEANEPDLMTQLAPLLRARKDLRPEDITYLEDVVAATLRRVKATRE